MNNPTSNPNQAGNEANRVSQTARYTLAGVAFGLAFPIVATALSLLVKRLAASPANIVAVQASDPLLWIIDTAPLFLGWLARFAGRRQDALLASNERLRQDEQALTSLKGNLEQGVAERTRELDQRNELMASLLRVTASIAAPAEVDAIVDSVSTLVPQNFGGLLPSVYLLDPKTGSLVLRGASSPEGKIRLTEGYSLPVGGPDPVSRAAAQGRVELDRSEQGTGNITEIALPLRARGRLIGALGLQPPRPRQMRGQETEVLQLLADQLAAALDSARLLEESKSSVAQLQSALQVQTDASWQEYVTRQSMTLQYTPAGVTPLPDNDRQSERMSLRVPLTLRGWQIGSIGLARQGGDQWSEDERVLVQKVALQAALAIDNNRLLSETRRRALHEQTVSEISARFNQTVDIEALLRTAAREFASLPGVAEAAVVIRAESSGASRAGRPSGFVRGYRYNNVRLDPINTISQAGMTALEKGTAVISEPAEAGSGQRQSAAVPIVLRGQVLGVVLTTFQSARAPEGAIAMVNQATERLATALENARLLTESMRRAEQETRIAEITAKIGSSISMRNVLETAVEELGHAIPGSEVSIKLRPSAAGPTKEGRQ